MSETNFNSGFQEAIETVERLPPDDQAMLIEIVRRHLIDERRSHLADEMPSLEMLSDGVKLSEARLTN